jgi:hypothetical protein
VRVGPSSGREGIAITQVVDGTGKLGTVGVLAAGLVGEHLFQFDTIELTIRVLVDGLTR